MSLIMLYMQVGVVFNKWRGVGLIMLYMEVQCNKLVNKSCEKLSIWETGVDFGKPSLKL